MSTIALVVCPTCQGEGMDGLIVCEDCMGTRRIAVDKEAGGGVPEGYIEWLPHRLPDLPPIPAHNAS